MRHSKAFLFVVLTIATTIQAAGPSPVMEYASVLSGLRVRHATGVLEFENGDQPLSAAFLPAGATVEAVVTQKGSQPPLVRQSFAVGRAQGVFHRVSPSGDIQQFKLTEPGDYVVTYLANRRVMTVVPFQVELVTNDDEFDPKTFVYLNGPWSNWAYLYAPLPDAITQVPEFRIWAKRKSFVVGHAADEYEIEVKLNGDVVATSNTGFISSQEGRMLRFPFRYPKSKGGRAMSMDDLTATDGRYQVVVKKNGALYAVWPFVVQDRQPVFHARQSSNHKPRFEYMVPRLSGIGDHKPGKIIFMERLAPAEARAVAQGRSAEAAVPSSERRKQWKWFPHSIAPRRPFRLTISNVETRTDTGFKVGEDLVVFGTDSPNGIKYLRAGEAVAREIPQGETYSSNVFCVCGKKIVLTKRHRVFVYDTETDTLTPVSESDISLYAAKSSLLTSDGYLVATVNKATAVKDRTILKVIDVSGPQPKIIPIKNGDYVDSSVTSVAVDAAQAPKMQRRSLKKWETCLAI